MKSVAILAAVAGALLWAGRPVMGQTDNWPQFRGPTGQGITEDKTLPVEWGGADSKNVLWTAPLKGNGQASPIVWGDYVITCTVAWPATVAENARGDTLPEHHVTCYQASDGKMLWDALVPPGPWKKNDFRNGPSGGYAAATPATDGKRIYAAFGSAVIAAVDFQGKVVWHKDVKPYTFDVTLATSPILYNGTLLMVCTMSKKEDSRVIAYDPATGDVKWTEPLIDTDFGHSTPVIIQVGGRPQMLVTGAGMKGAGNALQALDPATGKRLWWCKGMGEIPSPVYANGLVYFDGGRGGAGTMVDPTGSGDVSATHIKATMNLSGQAFNSPVVVDKYIYRLEGTNTLKCYEMATGKEVYSKKLDGISNNWASPVVDGLGRLFYATAGKSYVIQGGPDFKVLGTGDLGDANTASPAVSKGRMFLVGLKNIYCVGVK
jgi:outer membrane protein assembly factor BamB